MAIPVIAVFDVGKTNKKVFLFDEDYTIVYESAINITEVHDEDGFACDNIDELQDWLLVTWENIDQNKDFDIKALNFSGYGASFVLVDTTGEPIAPLYNYLKPHTSLLADQFYNTYGGQEEFSKITASPVLGNLNSGMQLYFLKYEKPQIFNKIVHALHLPQYLSSVFTKKYFSEITSIGCHTNLWNFEENNYHTWVQNEGITTILDPIVQSGHTSVINNVEVGIGLHDSSAALIPYLKSKNDSEQFILISTGTWCISINPSNDAPLTSSDLENDCLSYFQYNGKSVKASRVFAGQFHENQTDRISKYFNVNNDFYKTLDFDYPYYKTFKNLYNAKNTVSLKKCAFEDRDLSGFEDVKMAYYQLMLDLVNQQVFSTNLVLDNRQTIKHIYVDGGFGKNPIYLNMLSLAYPDFVIFGAEIAQASALGAAMILHEKWNKKTISNKIITLKKYKNA